MTTRWGSPTRIDRNAMEYIAESPGFFEDVIKKPNFEA